MKGRNSRSSSSSRGGRTSSTRIGVIASILAVTSIAYLIYASDIGKTRYEDLFLNASQISRSQQLTRKSHRAKFGANCKNYGVVTDPFFERFGGVYCGKERWESPSQFETSSDKYLQSVETVLKFFETADECKEYFYRFYGIHMYEPVAYQTLMDVTEHSPKIGDESHAFMWDPSQTQGVMQLEDAYLHKHVVYVFRSGRAFVKVTATGHIQAAAPELNPVTVSDIARNLHSKISRGDTTYYSRQFRRSIDSIVRRASKHITNFMDGAFVWSQDILDKLAALSSDEDKDQDPELASNYTNDNYTNFGDDDYDVRGIVGGEELVGVYMHKLLLDKLAFLDVAGMNSSDVLLFVSSLVSVFVLLIGSLAMSSDSEMDLY